ncbi:MAG: hypothetical protein WC389_21150 [Lutibacter sp.]|jgi:hypothetical protein
MMKNKITEFDFKLRLFVDTNVLIDFVEGYNDRKSVTCLNLFQKTGASKKRKVDGVELVTSDYVLWEFYGRCRQELYVRKLVTEHNYGFIQANKESKDDNFRKHANNECMKQFGKEINEYIQRITGNNGMVFRERLIGKDSPGFSEFIDEVLKCSKFSYKDAIVFVSALFTRANGIITCDEHHFNKDRIEQLKEAMKTCPIKDAEISFRKPEEFSTLDKIKLEYKNWFEKRNKSKIIGDIVKYYPRINVVEIKCKKGCSINENDSIYLVRFFEKANLGKFWLKVPTKASGNLISMKTKKPIDKGQHVTIKLPFKFPYKKKEWSKGWVFLAE